MEDDNTLPEMPEPKSNFTNWVLGIVSTLIVLGTATVIGTSIANSAHFAKLDLSAEQQVEHNNEWGQHFRELNAKLDVLPKAETIQQEFRDLSSRVSNNETRNNDQDARAQSLSNLVHDNRVKADSEYESIRSELKIYRAYQWGIINQDRWISQAEKKLGKTLPSVQDVTGKTPAEQ